MYLESRYKATWKGVLIDTDRDCYIVRQVLDQYNNEINNKKTVIYNKHWFRRFMPTTEQQELIDKEYLKFKS